jgi:two-component system, OmpR family, response regulator VanR
MPKKTVLLVDDDQMFAEPLVDALTHEGFRVLTARTAEEALEILARESVDLVTVDIMLDPGEGLASTVPSQTAGVYLCKEIKNRYPRLDTFCISVVSDPATVQPIKKLGIRILTKGEASLRTVLNILRSRLTGKAYTSGDRPRHEEW